MISLPTLTMMSTVLSTIKNKAALVLAGVTLVVGLLVGWHAGAWWFGPDWEDQVKLVQQQAEADQQMLMEKHERDLEIANSRVEIKEVIQYVTKDTRCDIPAPVVRMLDNARGVSNATERTFTGRRSPASPEHISQRQEIAAHADCGIRYRKLANQCQALIDWHKE